MKLSVRALSLIAVAGVVVSAANASVIFSFHSNGTHSISGSTVNATDKVFYDDLSTPYAPQTLAYTYSKTSPGGFAPTTGTGTIWVSGGSINFSFSGGVVGGVSGLDALAGAILTFSGGTGVLNGFTGTGSISNTLDVTDAKKHRTTFEAALVPEPASMIALGVGALGLIRRRRASK